MAKSANVAEQQRDAAEAENARLRDIEAAIGVWANDTCDDQQEAMWSEQDTIRAALAQTKGQ